MKDFAAYYLGFHHIDRDAVLPEHQIAIATQLMAERDDPVIIIMDDTYLFVQKFSDNIFQRRSYSMHKHRNLVKPMIITATASECSVYLYRNDPTPYGIGQLHPQCFGSVSS